MTRLLLLFLLSIAVAPSPSALADKGGRHGPRKSPAAAPAEAKPEESPEKAITAECDKKTPSPFDDPKFLAPRLPSSPTVADGKITDEQKAAFRYDPLCEKVRTSDGTADQKASCDLTLAQIVQNYRDERTSLEDTKKQVCEQAKKDAAGCAGQAEALKCVASVYNNAGRAFDELSARLKKKADELVKRQGDHLKVARERKTTAPDGKPLAAEFTANATIYVSSAERGAFVDREHQPNTCARGSPALGKDFCGHVIAAAEAKYFAATLEKASKITGSLGKALDDKGATALARSEKQGPPGSGDNKDGSDITKSKSGGMDLNDMIKLATLGATGASLYCSMTKKCGNSGDQAAATPADQALGGATSPTPNGTNEGGPEKSSTGDTKTGGSPSSPTGTDPRTADTSTSFHGSPGSGGGFSGSSSEPTRGGGPSSGGPSPASVMSVGGGSSGGGSLGGSLDHAASSEGTGAAGKSSDSGTGGFPGGGGIASAGTGFSLGDSHSATPTDAALKNILNGDTPPAGDAPLDALGTGGDAGANAAGTGAGAEDAESLFLRVRDTHVRCLKRGCVGREVGNNI